MLRLSITTQSFGGEILTAFKKLIFFIFFINIFIACSPAFYSDDHGEYDNYILGNGDTIRIEIYDSNDTELINLYKDKVIGYKQYEGWGDNYKINTFQVPLSGVVNITGFGDIYVTDRTIKDVRQELYTRALSFDKNPKVFVRLMDEKVVRIYVLGAVKNPGLIEVRDDGKRNNMYAIIAQAGGYKPQSDVTQVVLRHNNKDAEAVTINRDNFMTYTLKDGDYVYVSDSKDSVIVFGEVTYPGRYTFSSAEELKDYLGAAGGILDSASREIYLVNEDEKQNTKIVLDDKMRMTSHDGPLLIKPGTIIYVPKHFFASWREVLGNLLLIRDTVSLPKQIREGTD